MSAGWLYLAAMIVAYGVANFLQAVAAARVKAHQTLHPRVLLRLVRERPYVAGVGCQCLGYLLAFLARRDLPLFLVQASVAAGLGVTALLGIVLLKWRLSGAELALLALLGLGVLSLVISAKPGPSHDAGLIVVVALAAALAVIGGFAFAAVRLHGVPGAVTLGALAGLAFGAAAVASRPLANFTAVPVVLIDPLLYVLIAHSLVGQLLLGLALQRGSTTAAVASMDAASTAPAAAVGLCFLGDQIQPGREWLAAGGFVITLAAVLALTRWAEPQHPVPTPVPTPLVRQVAAPSTECTEQVDTARFLSVSEPVASSVLRVSPPSLPHGRLPVTMAPVDDGDEQNGSFAPAPALEPQSGAELPVKAPSS